MFQVVPPCGGHRFLVAMQSCFQKFQVVPPCGGHLSIWPVLILTPMFQVVPPCGGHQFIKLREAVPSSFKSCPRVGGIKILHTADIHLGVSSRAPVWGASAAPRLRAGSLPLFQVVPPCGGHLALVAGAVFANLVSSRAPLWGASY